MIFNRVINYIQKDRNLTSLLHGAGWMYAAGLVSIALTFLQQISTASLLGATAYGQLAIILGSNTLIMLFVDFRTWEICTKLFAKYQKHSEYSFLAGTITWYLIVDMVAGSIGILVVLAFAQFIASNLVQSPDLINEIRLFALIIPFRLLAMGVPTVVLRLYDRYQWLSVKSVIYAIARLILMTGAALLGFGVKGVIIGAVLGEIIHVGTLLILLKRAWQERTPREYPMLRLDTPQVLLENLRTLRELWVGGTLKGLQLETFIPLMAVISTPTQVGLYRVGLDIVQLISRITEPISVVIQPTVIQIYEQNSRQVFIRYLKQTTLILGIITLPLASAIIVLGPVIFPRILENFANLAQVVSILLIGYSLNSIIIWIRPVIVAMNLLHIHNFIAVASFVYSVFGLLLLSSYGAVGAAFVMTTLLVGNLGVSLLLIVYRLKGST